MVVLVLIKYVKKYDIYPFRILIYVPVHLIYKEDLS